MTLPRPRARAAVLAALLCLAGAVPALGAAEPEVAVSEFASSLPAGAVLVSSPDAREVEAVRGLHVPVGRGPAAAARGTLAWLTAAGAAFGLDPADGALAVTRTEAIAGGRTRVTLEQSWRGIPVVGAGARAVVSEAGELRAVATTLRAVSPDAAAPALPRERAVAVAAAAAGVDLAHVPAPARLVIVRAGDADRLVWEVAFERAQGLPVTVWIAASDGGVLGTDDGIARAVGLAYPTDPRDAYAEVALDRLLPAEGLASRAFAVEDQAGAKVAPLAPGDYRYPPEDPNFDQVNAYWHADHFLHDVLGPLGYAGPPESLIVRVHSPVEPYVALTSGRFVHLGNPIPGASLDAARSHDIIYHELVHAVLYGKDVQPGGVRREAGALHEGLADYFAAVATGDPAIGEWAYLLFPNGATRVDMPADPWDMAHYDRLSYASAPLASVWANGMVLSSALWDLRAEIGPACDSLVLEATDYLPVVPAWSHFANGLLQADEELHGGRYASAITGQLLRRGIRGAAVALFAGPTQLEPGQQAEFRAMPCCGEVLGQFEWWSRAVCRGTPCGEWQWLGAGQTLRMGFFDDLLLELRVRSPWGDTLRSTKRIALRAPTLDLDGPTRLVRGTVGTWTARTVAIAPVRVTWQRWWRRAGTLYQVFGSGAEQTFAAETSFTLVVTAQDGLGRRAQRVYEVETYTDRPPALASGVFRVSLVAPAGAREGELRYELLRNERLRVEVLDVAGRLRAVLADGPAGRGAHVLRFATAAYPPGVYLLRLRQGADRSVLRFAVLR